MKAPATRRVLATLALAASAIAAGAAYGDDSAPLTGFTLTDKAVSSGDTLRFVISGDVREQADRQAAIAVNFSIGECVEARRELVVAGIRWVELADGGFVEAARLDRIPEPVAGDLLVGEEGMIAGRILPDDYAPSDLVAIPDSLKSPGYEERSLRLRGAALAAFAGLVEAATADSITIRIFSAYRSAAFQRRLYASAVEKSGPGQIHTAAPGRSEHQLGTTADVSTPALPLLSQELEVSVAGRWLERHAAEFGIVQTFSRGRHLARGGAREPWHLRWVGERLDTPKAW